MTSLICYYDVTPPSTLTSQVKFITGAGLLCGQMMDKIVMKKILDAVDAEVSIPGYRINGIDSGV